MTVVGLQSKEIATALRPRNDTQVLTYCGF